MAERRVPLLFWKPLWVTVGGIILVVGGLWGFDLYLGSQLDGLAEQPPAQAKTGLEEFLASYSWSRRSERGRELLQLKINSLLDLKQSAGDPDGAVKLCVETQRRWDRGVAVARCKATLMDLKVGAATKKIDEGQVEAGLKELEQFIQTGLKGETMAMAKQEAARARFLLMAAVASDLAIEVLEEDVQELDRAFKGTEGAGAAQDLLTCRKLRQSVAERITASFLQGLLRCQEIVKRWPKTASAAYFASFLHRLDRSAFLVRMEATPSPKLPDQLQELTEQLQAQLSRWLVAHGRAPVFDEALLAGSLKPVYLIRLAYKDTPGKQQEKKCAQNRLMAIHLELLEIQGERILGTWEFASNEKGLKLPKETAPEECPKKLSDLQWEQVASWLNTVEHEVFQSPSAWTAVPEEEAASSGQAGQPPAEEGTGSGSGAAAGTGAGSGATATGETAGTGAAAAAGSGEAPPSAPTAGSGEPAGGSGAAEGQPAE